MELYCKGGCAACQELREVSFTGQEPLLSIVSCNFQRTEAV
ncbi:hypothetical protein Goklo_016724 [Gossypium klotzschianum]|uniref:Uncharacterized protein n=1 Tax=Gossypium klotzschianum TaxID=34286 RepID=A0A7J8UFB7_9ROSI|nr:hypothetical protein [Gossypium klotzschianum]